MNSSVFIKANELKDNLNQILENFIEVAQYWIEMEHANEDLILLKVSLRSNLQQTLDQISGDISGLVTYEIEIEDINSNGEVPISKYPTYKVQQLHPDFDRIYEDVNELDSLFNRNFIKEISIEGDDLSRYVEAKSIKSNEIDQNLKRQRVSYTQEKVFNLNRVIKIKVINELI